MSPTVPKVKQQSDGTWHHGNKWGKTGNSGDIRLKEAKVYTLDLFSVAPEQNGLLWAVLHLGQV